ncbi:hypothetical protein Glove_13g57 [Diversispora epigaea]|uniref:Uncharacterized protein n=1 Tax=Diversispora epigaea TaxID=1348612 RepID=A0A397JMQ4_9GLOM|nr:hypothetical protein Glove_13g57 [Diversispora epigaea]
MSSMKSIISILLVICLHIISSQARAIPGPWIVTDIAGKRKYPSERFTLEILSPSETTINVNLLQRGSTFNQSLLTNVKLHRESNKVDVELPSSGVESNPEYYFAIYSNGLRIDYSGTFQIGDPRFGITICKPVAGDHLKIGQTLKARWFGSFVPPGQSPADFTLVRALLEPALIPPIQAPIVSFNFFPGVNLTFSSNHLDFELPNSIPPNTLYKFGFLIVSQIPGFLTQIYSSGTFLIK